MRPHQWVKNLLVFLPAIAGHQLLDPNVFLRALTAFVLFSLCASGVYLVNDLLDLEADRKHPKKRDRPLAAGELDLSWASVAAAGLLAGSTVAAVLLLGGLFAVTLLGYVVVTSAYSIKLKGIAMVDALTLAGLYTTRVIAGGVATDIRSSFWLLAFSVFIFLSLAMVKRNAELIQVRRRGHTAAQGRGYFSDDLPLVQMCGVSAGYMSVLVLAMYIHAEAGVRYRHPELIWLLCPVVLYWTGRIWLKAHRGQMDEDPIVFALRDRPSILAGILAALVFLAAI
jgi:4-hydroxybenzoate polyprenyltransferase